MTARRKSKSGEPPSTLVGPHQSEFGAPSESTITGMEPPSRSTLVAALDDRTGEKMKAAIAAAGLPRVQKMLREYKQTRKAACLWSAYVICRRHGVALPDEILFYFDRVAITLCRASGDYPRAERAKI